MLYLVVLAAAEFLVAMYQPVPGIVLHGLVLVTLLLHASLGSHKEQRRFLLAFCLTPLIRILSLTIPYSAFQAVYWYMIVGMPLFVTAYLVCREVGITRRMAGLVWPAAPGFEILVALSGAGLGYLEYVILKPAPLAAELRWGAIWLPALILLIFTGLLEELIFRGMLQSAGEKFLGKYANLYVSGVFAVVHLGYRSVTDLIFVFGVALFFGAVIRRTGSILGVTLAHGLINILLYLVFPLLLG